MLSFLNSRLFGPVLPVFLCFSGLFFCIFLRFFPFSHPLIALKGVSGEGKKRSVRGMLTALAGTLGVGNITGVASAIVAGGPGAVFWMWVSAFFALFVKFAETVLACVYRKKEKDGTFRGGTPYTIKYGLKRPKTAAFFAILLLISTYFVGNITQTSAAADTAENMFSCPRALCGLLLSVLLYAIIAGGAKRIGDFAVSVIPILTAIFVLLSGLILWKNRMQIPSVFRLILADAFEPTAGVAGIFGYLSMRSLRFGTARGVFSNEAGCGTSPTAHAANAGNEPVEQGLFGMLEVFTDTLFLCTLTAFAVLFSLDSLKGLDGTELAIRAFEEQLGRVPSILLGLSVLVYALASTVAWAFYGSEALCFLGGTKKADRLYRLSYSVCCLLGAVIPVGTVWEISDLFVSLMTMVNLTCVLMLSGKVREETCAYLQRRGTISFEPHASEASIEASPHSQRRAFEK